MTITPNDQAADLALKPEDPPFPTMPEGSAWRQTLLHWLLFLALMTALIGGAAVLT